MTPGTTPTHEDFGNAGETRSVINQKDIRRTGKSETVQPLGEQTSRLAMPETEKVIRVAVRSGCKPTVEITGTDDCPRGIEGDGGDVRRVKIRSGSDETVGKRNGRG